MVNPSGLIVMLLELILMVQLYFIRRRPFEEWLVAISVLIAAIYTLACGKMGWIVVVIGIGSVAIWIGSYWRVFDAVRKMESRDQVICLTLRAAIISGPALFVWLDLISRKLVVHVTDTVVSLGIALAWFLILVEGPGSLSLYFLKERMLRELELVEAQLLTFYLTRDASCLNGNVAEVFKSASWFRLQQTLLKISGKWGGQVPEVDRSLFHLCWWELSRYRSELERQVISPFPALTILTSLSVVALLWNVVSLAK